MTGDMSGTLAPEQNGPAELQPQAPGTRPRARPEWRAGPRLVGLRVLHYVTNYLIAHIPSFTLRRLWYRHVLGVRLGRRCGIYLGCHVWFYTPRQVRQGGACIGDYSRVNRNCCLDFRGALEIGANVSISPEVMILTASHEVNDLDFRTVMRPVVIEDYVWIGSRALILPGVTLGRGSVIGAGAVVTRNVEPLSIVAGVPARPVGTRDSRALQYALEHALPLFE